jgi:hypothetical protein
MTTKLDNITLICLVLLASTVLGAEAQSGSDPAVTEAAADIYHSREEKREARLGIQFNDWLKLSGTLELEQSVSRTYLLGGILSSQDNSLFTTAEFALELTLTHTLSSEWLLEYDEQDNELSLDEASINWETAFGELSIGQLYIPFGIYYSHFIRGPQLEIAETSALALAITYELMDDVDLSVFALRSDIHKISRTKSELDWGAQLEMKFFHEQLQCGIAYLSDLAESDKEILSAYANAYQQRVAAWNLFSILRQSNWEASFETVWATKQYSELPTNQNKPMSHNLELAYYYKRYWEYALRYESSDELAGATRLQYGIGATWRPYRFMSLGIEYLSGRYKEAFVFDDKGESVSRTTSFQSRLTLEF